MKHLCVFCGSSPGLSAEYALAARELGAVMGRDGLGLVYGGGNVGLMGILADAVLAEGAEVIGVIPQALVEKELAHHGVTELIVVESMHERKAKMADLADGFVAMAGGFGTLDEFCEIVTWAQLGLHQKPCAVLNTDGFYDAFLAQVDHGVEKGFVPVENREMLIVHSNASKLLDQMLKFRPRSPVPKWLGREER